MKILFIIGLTVFLPLAVIVGLRLSSDALAILAGGACGLVPTIAMAAIVVALLRREKKGEPAPQNQYPPVIVINPGDARTQLPMPPMQASLPAPGNNRKFDVVGSDADVYDWEDDV